MHPKFFGDSYDLVKREIIHGLGPADKWAVHPMYFDPEPEPGFVDRYATFLGIDPVAGDIGNRDEVLPIGKDCRQHLFLDPDTGLWNGQNRPRNSWRKHVSMEELADIANASGREHKLTLVYDQSYQYPDEEERKLLAEWKLQILQIDHLVHGVAYVSHTVFIWVSKDEDLLAKATRQLLDRSGLPLDRFVDDGCGRNHIGA